LKGFLLLLGVIVVHWWRGRSTHMTVVVTVVEESVVTVIVEVVVTVTVGALVVIGVSWGQSHGRMRCEMREDE
jgi:predicted branched-subunit amino acid permease